MLKREIREFYKKKRQKLSELEWLTKNRAITDRLFQWNLLEKVSYLHLFLPITRQKEPDLWSFIYQVWEEKPHITLLVSRTHPETHSLSHYIFTEATEIQENRWGVPEPLSTEIFENLSAIDMVLIPLLAFDAQGYRVGYGKGFYDRFLSECPQALKVGISLFEALHEPISDTNEYDIKLDFCITPMQLYDFSSPKS
jgi:5-formyltetrahydrofolate cyclo-ligase